MRIKLGSSTHTRQESKGPACALNIISEFTLLLQNLCVSFLWYFEKKLRGTQMFLRSQKP